MNFQLLIPIIILSFSFSFEGNTQVSLIDISTLSSEFTYDIRYATSHNFIGEVLYDCAKCLLRPKVAQAFLEANQFFCERGYRIKIFDCYRPLDIQKKMWDKVPEATYVANPYEGGSIHNKGAAVDITLETLEGRYVEMGTDYDYFGLEAHIDNYTFSNFSALETEKILENRNLLFEGMLKFGFQPISSEWWHFSFRKNKSYSLLNQALPCND